MSVPAHLPDGWQRALSDEFDQTYMHRLRDFLAGELAAGRGFFPAARQVFAALEHTPLEQVKVVLLGLISTDTVSAPGSVRPLAHPVHGSCPVGAAWVSACVVAA